MRVRRWAKNHDMEEVKDDMAPVLIVVGEVLSNLQREWRIPLQCTILISAQPNNNGIIKFINFNYKSYWISIQQNNNYCYCYCCWQIYLNLTSFVRMSIYLQGLLLYKNNPLVKSLMTDRFFTVCYIALGNYIEIPLLFILFYWGQMY